MIPGGTPPAADPDGTCRRAFDGRCFCCVRSLAIGKLQCLSFDHDGRPLGTFSKGLLFLNSGADRVLVLDPDGTVVRDTGPIDELNPGGGNFGLDGRYYVGLRSARTIIAFPVALDAAGEHVLSPGTVPFVSDPELSPLDPAIAPNGNIIVSSERPFGAPDAVTSVREYDPADGHLVRVLSAGTSAKFRKPRGLRFGPDGNPYCVAQDEVVAFDFASGECLGAVVRLSRLNGQALAFFFHNAEDLSPGVRSFRTCLEFVS